VPTAREELTGRIELCDPYAELDKDLVRLQLDAVAELLEVRRRQIKVLDRRAIDSGVSSIGSLQDAVPLLFSHTTYKSYPEAFVAKENWAAMNTWLSALSTQPVDVDVSGVSGPDEWLARLHKAGHFVFFTSGTSGKASFVNQTGADKEITALGMVRGLTWTTGLEPRQDRPVFILGPHLASTRYGDKFDAISDAFGRPGSVYHLFDEPLSIADQRRTATLRVAMSAGTAMPADIATAEAEAADRAERMAARFDLMTEWIVKNAGEPVVLFGLWPQLYDIMLRAREKGAPERHFHSGNVLLTGGGLKGTTLPDDYQQQISSFFNVGPGSFHHSYGMQELSTALPKCRQGRYHCPPWIVLLPLDAGGEQLVDTAQPTTARFGFIDLMAEGHWGGMMSGDQVQVDYGTCGCGRSSPSVWDIVRFRDLGTDDDKLNCAGTIDAYVRGAVGE
jgi:hypothetical protein